MDLGSGNGLPGLVLAAAWAGSRWYLVESSADRCEFLRWAIAALGLTERVSVAAGPAERVGREEELRGRCDLVVARAFGGPGPTAECGGAFLKVGGRLVVSEPPSADDRWPASGLETLGLEAGRRIAEPVRLQELVRVSPVPDEYPRRLGVPRRKPLF